MDNSRKIEKGILYIAFGGRCLQEAIYSVKSLKKVHPDIHTTLFTERQSQTTFTNFDIVKFINPKSIRIKQYYLSSTPYKKTLYLDADTAIIGDVSNVFDLLERFDIAATQDHIRIVPERNVLWGKYAKIPESFPEYGGGVILFKMNDTVRAFFDKWVSLYEEWCTLSGKINDQPSFRVALWETSNLKLHTLPPEYNIRTQEKRNKSTNIVHRILHWHNMPSLGLNLNRQVF